MRCLSVVGSTSWEATWLKPTRLPLLGGHRALRLRQRDQQRGEREQRQQRRDVAHPVGAGGDAGQHVDVRVADREPPAAALGDDIGGQGEGNQRQPQQQERLLERHYFACSSASSIRGIGTFSSTSSSTRSASTPAASAS